MANQHIKGITVEIGGDTSELSQVLKGVDKDAKRVDDELRSVNAALKVDPSNVVALTQKTELLAQSIEQAKKKVDILKKAEADAQKQLERGEIGADQFRALQREVVFAEGKLKKLEKQLDDTRKAASQEGDAVEKSGKDAKDAAKDNEKLSKSLDDLKSDYDDAKSSAAQAGAEFGATLAGAAAVGVAATMQAMSYADALRTIQMQTGASEDAMRSYEMAMKAVFDSGLGEDLDDVASTMAIIAQQTGQTDPDKLEAMAKNALVLRESFGYETQEQLRTVDMLVKQFHIDEAQAFNLIAEASQRGLNKNGDLLDIINEYAVHYKNLGYNQDEFFNSLANGADTGVFSIDKLGDATKEFGIRTKDETTSTTEAYEMLGLNADEMRAKFAQGGQAAKDAAKEVNEALFSMSDEVKQNTVGVGLYGTMWEDLGKDAISAMTNAKGEISATGDAMERVRDIKLDATSTKWSKLGRTVQTELLLPIGEKLLPYVEKFFNFCIENSEDLIPIAKALGVALTSAFATNKAANLIASVNTLTKAFGKMKAAIPSSTGALSLLGIAASLAAETIRVLAEDESEAARAAREMTKANLENAKATGESYRKSAELVKAIDEEYDTYKKLWEELQQLVDAEGNVIAGNEKRVDQIRGELSDALGEEIGLVEGQIQKYDELSSSIEKMLLMKQAERVSQTYESEYYASQESLPQLQLKYEEANATFQEAERRKRQYAHDVEYWEHNELTQDDPKNQALWERIDENRRWIEDHPTVVEDLTAASFSYDTALQTVRLYEDFLTAYDAEDLQALPEAISNLGNGMLTNTSGARAASLEYQAVILAQEYSNLLGLSKTAGTSITSDQLTKAYDDMRLAIQQVKEAKGRRYGSESFLTAWSQYSGNVVLERQAESEINELFAHSATINPTLANIHKPITRNVLQGFIDATAENHIPYDLTTPAAETAKQNNELLGQILRKIDELDLQIVLDDGTVAGRVDQHIGKDAADQKRGALK